MGVPLGSKNRQGCCCGGCKVRFVITGCSVLPLAGATCSVWSDAGKAVFYGSGVTDCNGVAEFQLDGASDPWYYEVSHPSGRLVAISGTNTCSGQKTRQVARTMSTVAPGFHCISSLVHAIPLPETLYYSDPFNGPITLTYTTVMSGCSTLPGTWAGTTTTTFPAGANAFGQPCAGITEAVTIELVGSSICVRYNKTSASLLLACPGGTLNSQASQSTVITPCSTGAFSAVVHWPSRTLNVGSTTAYDGVITE